MKCGSKSGKKGKQAKGYAEGGYVSPRKKMAGQGKVKRSGSSCK